MRMAKVVINKHLRTHFFYLWLERRRRLASYFAIEDTQATLLHK
jgi:hypothetical protein